MCPCFHFIVHMDSRPLRAPVGSDLFSRFHGLVLLFPYKLYSSLPCTVSLNIDFFPPLRIYFPFEIGSPRSPSRRLVKQAPRLVVILPGSSLLLDPRLILPSFLFPPARNITASPRFSVQLLILTEAAKNPSLSWGM
jgi:hypothetical protein